MKKRKFKTGVEVLQHGEIGRHARRFESTTMENDHAKGHETGEQLHVTSYGGVEGALQYFLGTIVLNGMEYSRLQIATMESKRFVWCKKNICPCPRSKESFGANLRA